MAVSFPLQVVFEAVDRMSGPLSSAGKSLSKFGRSATNVGRTLSVGITAPVVGLGAAAIRTASGFQAGMNRVQALIGETAGEAMPALTEQAKELGATTAFTAREAADGMGFLAQAGFNAAQIMEALPATLDLAAAGQLELAEAADIASNVVTGYGLAVAETSRVVDVLASTSSSANTDVTQLGEAFKIAGPVAAGMGLELEETAAALGVLGNAGFQASLAGTALRGAMSKLAKPSAEAVEAMVGLGIVKDDLVDSDGNVRSLAGAVEILATRGATTADLLTIFGERAGPAMAALVGQGVGPIRELQAKLEDAGGTAQRIAEIQMQGAAGAMARLRSAFEGVLIAVADSGLLEAFTGVAEGIAGWLGELREANPALLRMGTIVAGVAATFGPLLVGVGQIALGLGGFAQLAGAAAPIISKLGMVFTATVIPAVWGFTTALLANPITWIVGLVAGLGFALYKLATTQNVVRDAIGAAWDWVVDKVKWAVGWVGDLARQALDLLPDWLLDFVGLGGTVNVAPQAGNLFSEGSRPADPRAISTREESVTRTEGTVRLELGQLPPGATVTTSGDLGGLDLELGPAMLGGA